MIVIPAHRASPYAETRNEAKAFPACPRLVVHRARLGV